MNEQEAIEQLSGEYLATNGTETPARVRYHNEALDTAIAALKEVQEYHATGRTPSMVRALQVGYIRAKKRLDEYIAIGTPEQCKGAVECTRWIPVSERMPEERDSIFKGFIGTPKWTPGMFERFSDTVIATVRNYDGKTEVRAMHTVDGRWRFENFSTIDEVIAWMPLPEPYHIADASKKVGDSE